MLFLLSYTSTPYNKNRPKYLPHRANIRGDLLIQGNSISQKVHFRIFVFFLSMLATSWGSSLSEVVLTE